MRSMKVYVGLHCGEACWLVQVNTSRGELPRAVSLGYPYGQHTDHTHIFRAIGFLTATHLGYLAVVWYHHGYQVPRAPAFLAASPPPPHPRSDCHRRIPFGRFSLEVPGRYLAGNRHETARHPVRIDPSPTVGCRAGTSGYLPSASPVPFIPTGTRQAGTRSGAGRGGAGHEARILVA